MDDAEARIVGRVTGDPVAEEYQPEKWLARFSVARNREYKGRKEVDFFRCVAFGRTAEIVREHLRKGRHVLVKADIRQHRWDDNGDSRENVQFVVQQVLFLGAPERGREDSEKSSGPTVSYHEDASVYDPGGEDAPF